MNKYKDKSIDHPPTIAPNVNAKWCSGKWCIILFPDRDDKLNWLIKKKKKKKKKSSFFFRLEEITTQELDKAEGVKLDILQDFRKWTSHCNRLEGTDARVNCQKDFS